MSTFAERMKKLREYRGLTQAECADKIGKSENTVWAWENDKNKPHINFYKTIAEKLECNELWLRTGDGKMFDTKPHSTDNFRERPEAYANDYSGEYELNIWATIGAGNTIDYNMQDFDPENNQPFMKLKVSGIFKNKTRDCFRVRGDSMHDKVRDKAIIGCNFKDKAIVTGKMYVLYLPHEGFTVKELHVEHKGVKVHAYNPSIKDYYLGHDEIDEHLVVGRVVWWLNEDDDKIGS